MIHWRIRNTWTNFCSLGHESQCYWKCRLNIDLLAAFSQWNNNASLSKHHFAQHIAFTILNYRYCLRVHRCVAPCKTQPVLFLPSPSPLHPHCEQFSGKDCVIAFPANVCKSGPAVARAPSQPYDWCSVTWEMTRACQARSRGKGYRGGIRSVQGCVCVCVWPIVIQASERLATHVVLDASVAERRAPPGSFTFPPKLNRKRQQASL